jgi:hypothetical protein
MVVLNSPAKIALRRAIALTSEGLALDAFICRFYVEVVELYISSYCPVQMVPARRSSVSQQESIGLLTGLVL